MRQGLGDHTKGYKAFVQLTWEGRIRYVEVGIQANLKNMFKEEYDMSAKFLSLIAGVSALALAGTVQAAEPVHAAAPMQLSVAQMDSVTAAGKDNNGKKHKYNHKNFKKHLKHIVCKTKNTCKPTPTPPKGSAVADASASATASAPATYNVKTDAFAFTDTTVTATTVSAVSVATASSSAKPATAAPAKK